MKNGLEDYYVIRGNKKMRFGYTTGSCAAAACKGAAEILLGGVMHKAVTLMTPKGILLTLELKDIRIEGNQVTCAIQKDAGDDPDTTNGILVYATVQKTKEPGIILDGGVGVGRVTKAGLSQKIGEAAINPVPKAMILREATEIAEKYDIRGLHLLAAEDNELNAEIIEMLLTDDGAKVTVAKNGRQAVECFENNPPGTFDAILMDVMMPVMDGIAATKAIRAMDRADAKTIPIIAMTANAFEEDAKRCLAAGMTAHLAKPFQIEDMEKAIVECCGK